MTGILSIRSKTALLLGQALSVPVWYELPDGVDQLIRWGSRKSPDFMGQEINNVESIKLASDKASCRQFLEDRGFPVPIPSESEFPIIGRIKHHTGGHGFFVIHNEEEMEHAKKRGAIYFSKIFPKTDEYRVHVAGGRVLLFSEKVGDKTKLIWNKTQNNFDFRHMRRSEWLNNELLMQVAKMAKRVVNAMELDFGAVDIMVNNREQLSLFDAPLPFVICEVNTAPSLSPLAISKYVKFFKEELALD